MRTSQVPFHWLQRQPQPRPNLKPRPRPRPRLRPSQSSSTKISTSPSPAPASDPAPDPDPDPGPGPGPGSILQQDAGKSMATHTEGTNTPAESKVPPGYGFLLLDHLLVASFLWAVTCTRRNEQKEGLSYVSFFCPITRNLSYCM